MAQCPGFGAGFGRDATFGRDADPARDATFGREDPARDATFGREDPARDAASVRSRVSRAISGPGRCPGPWVTLGTAGDIEIRALRATRPSTGTLGACSDTLDPSLGEPTAERRAPAVEAPGGPGTPDMTLPASFRGRADRGTRRSLG